MKLMTIDHTAACGHRKGNHSPEHRASRERIRGVTGAQGGCGRNYEDGCEPERQRRHRRPPAARLHVSGPPGELALRVQVNGQTKLAVDPNGGVSAGGFVTPPADGLYVAGKVGIGTANPEVALDVVGRTDITMVDNRYDHNDFSVAGTTFTWRGTQAASGRGIEVYGMDGSYGLNPDYDAIAPVGIRSDGWIASAMGIVVYSDRRIKRDIQASPAAKDLAAIQQLQVTDYRMVDPADGGMAWRKGFIAQEVEKMMPLAVTRSTEFVPDIFSVATAVAYDPAVKTLTLTLAKDHGLKSGDRVRLHIDGNRKDLNVSSVPSAREFVVEQCGTSRRKSSSTANRSVISAP